MFLGFGMETQVSRLNGSYSYDYFIPLKSNMLFQDRIGPKPNSILKRLVGLSGGHMSSCLPRPRVAFTNWKHLWRRCNICPLIRGQRYLSASGLVLLYDSETWTLRTGDTGTPSVFVHWCLHSIARTRWVSCINNPEVRCKIFAVLLNAVATGTPTFGC